MLAELVNRYGPATLSADDCFDSCLGCPLWIESGCSQELQNIRRHTVSSRVTLPVESPLVPAMLT